MFLLEQAERKTIQRCQDDFWRAAAAASRRFKTLDAIEFPTDAWHRSSMIKRALWIISIGYVPQCHMPVQKFNIILQISNFEEIEKPGKIENKIPKLNRTNSIQLT